MSRKHRADQVIQLRKQYKDLEQQNDRNMEIMFNIAENIADLMRQGVDDDYLTRCAELGIGE